MVIVGAVPDLSHELVRCAVVLLDQRTGVRNRVVVKAVALGAGFGSDRKEVFIGELNRGVALANLERVVLDIAGEGKLLFETAIAARVGVRVSTTSGGGTVSTGMVVTGVGPVGLGLGRRPRGD